MKLSDLVSFNQNAGVIEALVKTILSLILLPIFMIGIFIHLMILELPHYLASIKHNDQHKDLGYSMEKEGNLVKVAYKNKCSCGKQAPPKNISDLIERLLKTVLNYL